MIKQQGIKAKLKSRQQGAVAIIVAICLVVLIGMLGLVLDLGHLYVTKTELQNAADASALSGAKELNGTKIGVQNAITAAVNIARMNNFDFQKKPVGTNAADGGLVISVGSCPDDSSGCGWMFASDVGEDADAVGKNFLKVETGNRDLNTWFAHVLPGASSSTSTFGMAVAGRYVTPITPIGVCALRDEREAWVKYGTGSNDEYKVEFGYMRGVNYDLLAINDELSGLGNGTKIYIHPTATSEADCAPSQGNADFATPFLCTGKSAIGNTFNSKVFTNTGLDTGKAIAAINTRFDLYGAPLDKSLDYTVCAPDANIKQYTPEIATNWMTATSTPDQAAIYGLADWLAGPVGGGLRSALPSVPPGTLVDGKENKGGCDGNCSDNYGVLWSYTKPVKKSGNFTTDDWAMLYPTGLSSPALAYKDPSPYKYGLANTSNATYFLSPSHTGSTAPEPRRILNALIIDCPASSGGSCRPLDVLGVGKFFMQRGADNTNNAWITGEFAGIVPEAELTSVIRLYR